MRSAPFWVTLAASAAGLAFGKERPLNEDAKPWGAPTRIVAPEFPKAALESTRGGWVDVSGVVSPFRNLEEITLEPDNAADGHVTDAYSRDRRQHLLDMFEREVTRALSQWKYPPRTDASAWAACYEVNFSFKD